MELLMISDTKLKIMLSKEDMDTYALDGENVDYDSTETRRAFWAILDEAKHRTGFDAASDKVLIQLYPSRDGGCELFVTKLGMLPPLTEKTLARSGRAAMLTCRRAVYRFSSLSDLTDAARILSSDPPSRASRVYLGDDGLYYLVTEERGGKGDLSDLSRVTEFGDLLSPNTADYIREHGKCLAEGNAVSLFASL